MVLYVLTGLYSIKLSVRNMLPFCEDEWLMYFGMLMYVGICKLLSYMINLLAQYFRSNHTLKNCKPFDHL